MKDGLDKQYNNKEDHIMNRLISNSQLDNNIDRERYK